MLARLVDAWSYARIRPVGRAIARAWPELCLDDYSWPSLLDVKGARQRTYRIYIEWRDLRRHLTAYLPDAEIPAGPQEDPVRAEAGYLARGLRRSALQPREEAPDPSVLPPVPEGLGEAVRFLLQVWREMLRWRCAVVVASPVGD